MARARVTNDEKVFHALLEARGYIVSQTRAQFAIGEQVPLSVGRQWPDTEAHFYVIAETDEADYLAQRAIISGLGREFMPPFGPGTHFYRVQTD
jgi:hypothetical protein